MCKEKRTGGLVAVYVLRIANIFTELTMFSSVEPAQRERRKTALSALLLP